MPEHFPYPAREKGIDKKAVAMKFLFCAPGKGGRRGCCGQFAHSGTRAGTYLFETGKRPGEARRRGRRRFAMQNA